MRSTGMQKRYQVFLSSTYEDLKEERAEVIQALLELDCMPSGMELFPAATEEQWAWIKRVIGESDYYIVIVGGRYGSIHKAKKISYTEMEYRYALEIGKPIIAFLHEDPEQLPRSKTESNKANYNKLKAFRELCQKKLCKYWTSTSDLGAKVSRSITQLQKTHPGTGWVRLDEITEIESEATNLLRSQIAELEDQISGLQDSAYSEFDFADGGDEITLDFFYELKKKKINKAGNPYWVEADGEWHSVAFTWDGVLATIGHKLLLSPSEGQINGALVSSAKSMLGLKDTARKRIVGVKISSESIDSIRTQFLAQGLVNIKKSEDRFDRNYIWVPTQSAKNRIIEILASFRSDRTPGGDS